MECKIITVRIPSNTHVDIQDFTMEENYMMLQTGIEYIIYKKKYNIEPIHELVEKIKKMETQLAKLKCELQTYGVVYTD